MLIWNLALILVLVGLNGFFVSVEFAAVASRRSRIEIQAEAGNPAAQIVQGWLENPAARDRLIAASQLGITIVSLALGAVGENTFERLLDPYFHALALPAGLSALAPVLAALPLVLSLIIVTSLHVVLGEQVPKVAALHAPESFALWVARPMRLFSAVFRWFVDVLDWATRGILRLAGIDMVGEHALYYSVEELKQIVTDSTEGGVLAQPESEMLHAIFDLNTLVVRQVMVPRTEMVGVEASQSLDAVIALSSQHPYTKFPVYEENLDQILGVIHVRDVIRAMLDTARKDSTARSLCREALYVPDSISVNALLREFRLRRQHIAIVLDEFGGTAGLVTLEDLLEEIVGEVSGPFDTAQPDVQSMPDGTLLIDGLTLIEDVNETLDLNLQDPFYDTIAGYILGKLGRIPKVNDVLEGDGVRLKIVSMDGLRIERVSLAHLDGAPHSPAAGEPPA
jgi:CBS domain containing-hemolysin-like protein